MGQMLTVCTHGILAFNDQHTVIPQDSMGLSACLKVEVMYCSLPLRPLGFFRPVRVVASERTMCT